MNKKMIKFYLIISFIIISLISDSAYADVVYPTDFEPTLPYFGIMVAFLTAIIIVGIVILIVIHKKNTKNLEDSKDFVKNQEERKDV